MEIDERIAAVRNRIAEAALGAGRKPEDVRLVGVSKGVPAEVIVDAIVAGLTDVGENRVQEAAAKRPTIAASVATAPRWHLVGHLQSNKARVALRLFDTIQSIDSVKIAHALDRLADRPIDAFLEIQFQRTPERYGFDPDDVGRVFEELADLPSLNVVGLMTVAPLGLDDDGTRQVFRRLREIRDRLVENHRDRPRIELSMGMTDDYPIAVAEGATVVRIGRAIFAS